MEESQKPDITLLDGSVLVWQYSTYQLCFCSYSETNTSKEINYLKRDIYFDDKNHKHVKLIKHCKF